VNDLAGINEYALGLASRTLGIKAVAASITLRSEDVATLTGTNTGRVSNLSALVITTLVHTLTVVTVVIRVPLVVVRYSGNNDLGTLGTVNGSSTVAIILACNALRVLVATVFTSVAEYGRLMYTHLVEADVTLVVLIVIVTAGNVLPAVLTHMAPALNVLTNGTAADVTYVVLIFVNALGNRAAAVVTVVTAVVSNVLAHLCAAKIARVVGIVISTLRKSLAANVTVMVVVGVSALACLLAAVITVVAAVSRCVSTYSTVTSITLVVCVNVHALGGGLTAVITVVLAGGSRMLANSKITRIALVILVRIHVSYLIVSSRCGNGICSRSVRELSSALGTFIVLVISLGSTGGLCCINLDEHMSALVTARNES
jgi:hypothetical protein